MILIGTGNILWDAKLKERCLLGLAGVSYDPLGLTQSTCWKALLTSIITKATKNWDDKLPSNFLSNVLSLLLDSFLKILPIPFHEVIPVFLDNEIEVYFDGSLKRAAAYMANPDPGSSSSYYEEVTLEISRDESFRL